ncbi:hypothetical protein BKA56DRAFT_582794 [Ilyonectria sp. MPI-CAGE-AT-0026]|nr:hypothetical protein BKA56DRAFT_582794 [Ilyonectria sp. MPI-CAGE-AT-0026]
MYVRLRRPSHEVFDCGEVWCVLLACQRLRSFFSSRRAHDGIIRVTLQRDTLQGHSHSQLPHPDSVVSQLTRLTARKRLDESQARGWLGSGNNTEMGLATGSEVTAEPAVRVRKVGGRTTHHHAPPRTTSHHYALFSHCEKHGPVSQELHLWSLQSHLNPPFPPFFAPTNNAPFPLVSSAFSPALQLVSRRPGIAKPGVRSSTWFRGSGSSLRASQIPPSWLNGVHPHWPFAFDRRVPISCCFL